MSQTNTSEAGHNYFSVLDLLRGIAAVFVLIRHMGGEFDHRFNESFLAVDLFFLMSGVVIAGSHEQRLLKDLTVGRFFWLRVVRIFPLYLLGLGLGLAAVLAGKSFAGSIPSALLLNAGLLPYFGGDDPFPFNYVAWSLFFEMAANLAYAVLLRNVSFKWMGVIALASGLGLVAYVSTVGSMDVGWTSATFIGGFFRIGYSFFLGILVYRFFQYRPWAWKASHGTLLASIVTVAVLVLLGARISGPYRLAYELASVLCLFPLLVLLSIGIKPQPALTKAFKFIGLMSYPIYVLHLPLSLVYRNTVLTWDFGVIGFHALSAPFSGIVFLIFMVLVSWALHRVYDNPVRQRLLKDVDISKLPYFTIKKPMA
jgi:peptidoglycan/LPS O-acetylase OafA/YrhL